MTTALTPPIKWHDIPGCEGYRAYEDGSLWSCWTFRGAGYAGQCGQVMSDCWKKLTPDRRPCDQRKRYTLRRSDGSYRRTYGSVFILEAFVGPRPEGMEACHDDGDCTNDAADNLRWDTVQANHEDMARHGTRVRGEKTNTAKLTESDVLAIRASPNSATVEAKKYGVSVANIHYIRSRHTWQHI